MVSEKLYRNTLNQAPKKSLNRKFQTQKNPLTIPPALEIRSFPPGRRRHSHLCQLCIRLYRRWVGLPAATQATRDRRKKARLILQSGICNLLTNISEGTAFSLQGLTGIPRLILLPKKKKAQDEDTIKGNSTRGTVVGFEGIERAFYRLVFVPVSAHYCLGAKSMLLCNCSLFP